MVQTSDAVRALWLIMQGSCIVSTAIGLPLLTRTYDQMVAVVIVSSVVLMYRVGEYVMASLDMLPYCQRCNLCVTRHSVVQGKGPVPSRFMVVVDAANNNENKLGEPIIGEEFEELLHCANLVRAELYITNAVKCWPPERAPSKSEIATCRHWLTAELAVVKPEIIILMGDTAMKAFGVQDKISVAHGKVMVVNGIKIVCMYHPAAGLHQIHLKDIMRADWLSLRAALGHEQKELYKYEAPSMKSDMFGATRLAIDTETENLIDQSMVKWSVAWDNTALEYKREPRYSATALNPEQTSLMPMLKAKRYIGFNIKYDLNILQQQHVELTDFDDVQILAYLLNEPSNALKPLILYNFGIKARDAGDLLEDVHNVNARAYAKRADKLVVKAAAKKAVQKVLASLEPAKVYKRHKSLMNVLPLPEPKMSEVPKDVLNKYAAGDAGLTLALFDLLRAKLPKSMEYLYNIELQQVPILLRMEQAGMQVDKARAEELLAKWTEEAEGVEEWLKDYGIENPRSSVQKEEKLKRLLRSVPKPKKTKSKKRLATGRKILEAFTQDSMVVLLLNYSELIKMCQMMRTVLRNLDANNRVHTHFNQCVAKTGRLTSSDPLNLQNVPHNTERGLEFRSAFVARKGYKLVKADLSQAELRILAHFSNEPALMEAFRWSRDVHEATARVLWPDFDERPLEDRKRLRQIAKFCNFAMSYEATGPKVAEMAGLPIAEGNAVVELYFNKFPKIREYQEWAHAKARTDGYIEDVMGRRLYLPEINSSDPGKRAAAERQAGNMPIQGSVASIIKERTIEVDNRLPSYGGYLILQEHDQLIAEVPEEQADACANMMKTVMEDYRKLDVFLVADAKVADRWSDL